MKEELTLKKIPFQSQVSVPIVYKGKKVDQPLRLDLLVDDLIIIEIKVVECLHPVFNAQLLSYLKLAKYARFRSA